MRLSVSTISIGAPESSGVCPWIVINMQAGQKAGETWVACPVRGCDE